MEHLFLRTEVFFCSRNILIFFEEKLKYWNREKRKTKNFWISYQESGANFEYTKVIDKNHKLHIK